MSPPLAPRLRMKTRRKKLPPRSVVLVLCEIIADLLKGGRHNRHTVARQTGRSLGTADRWLEAIEALIPGARRVKLAKTAWLEIPREEPWRPKKRPRAALVRPQKTR